MKIKTTKTLWLVTTLLVLALLTMTLVACGSTQTPAETTPETTPDATTNVEGNDTTVETTPDADTQGSDEETQAPQETEAPTEAETEAETDAPTLKEQLGLEINMSDLSAAMQPIFSGNTSVNETVMFLDKGDTKSLLYPIKSVTSVTSYDGKKTYVEGTDYAVVDGKLQVLAGSSIPCITSARYYNHSGSLINTKNPATGQMSPTFWGESQVKAWQVCVTYTHDTTWEGYTQESKLDIYQNFIKKLQAGEDVTVFFYGDSITWGACSSFQENATPKQGSYAMLVVEALADLFDYTVKYVNTGLKDTMACAPVPSQDYVAGTRGTITYVNTAIGGWTSDNGVQKLDSFVKTPIQTYGCDLFIVAFGMNDGGGTARATASNIEKIVDGVYSVKPDAAVVLLSTMVPHNDSNWDFAAIRQQENQLQTLAKKYRVEKEKACAVACMTSVSKAVLEHKTFNDYSGNNINHPNDWFYRVYAQTIIQTLIGYENMN